MFVSKKNHSHNRQTMRQRLSSPGRNSLPQGEE